ncbi:Root meristem growth factor 10 [Cardamine amara subsp. amara]|uniref:Root meristem growth factor 10 n=1 Tax=Cardamine amara subsp. amara TaxID=228776 RepID=A0ABD1BQ02_CARAN
MDMLMRSTCFYSLFIVFFILSWSRLCDCRHLGPIEKKLCVNRDHLVTKNNEETTKLEAPSTNKMNTLSRQAHHPVVNNGEINGQTNGKRKKDDRRVKRASLGKTLSSKRVSRTWKVPKYSKKQPRSDQEHPGFNLDYMQPTTHPPHHN